MQRSSRKSNKQKCNALCCRLSVSSSSEESQSFCSSDNKFPAISSLTHAMVQERLEQMIREKKEEITRRHRAKDHGSSSSSNSSNNNNNNNSSSKFIVMVAMEKCSYDPREDFRESIEQMIMANRIYDPKDLRRLLNCYVSMNSEESRGVILEVFHEVCTTLFLSCKYHASGI